MARITKTGGRKPVTEGKLCMSRFKGAMLDSEAGVTQGFRLLVPLDKQTHGLHEPQPERP